MSDKQQLPPIMSSGVQAMMGFPGALMMPGASRMLMSGASNAPKPGGQNTAANASTPTAMPWGQIFASLGAGRSMMPMGAPGQNSSNNMGLNAGLKTFGSGAKLNPFFSFKY